MLTLQYLRNNKDDVIARLAVKHFDAKEIAEKILTLDADRRQTQTTLDQKLSQANQLSKEIGQLFSQGKKTEGDGKKNESLQLKEDAKGMEEKLKQVEDEIHQLLVRLPNLPHASVPPGRTPEENVVVRSGGVIPQLPADALPHWELTSKYDIINFELGNKVTGAGFPFYKGKGAKLQRALISFFLQNAIDAGYTEYQPPLLVNADTGFGTGQLPDKDGQMYFVNEDGFYLIPTAEVPVTNIYRDVLLKEEQLPVKMCAYSQCFRREAGSYGKDVRGLNRLHQFDKVEIVRIEHPDNSYAVLEEMVSHVESLVQKLELPYRILKLCGGDMSFASALTYDFEVFCAAQKRWLEVSSVSNFETFQSNRMKLRFKDKDGKTQLAHTLNGSALALPRIVASVLENNQTPEGIRIPQALQQYTSYEMID
ncbi:MAG TPA: serine--tRNA ligase [Chitinophagales bacterium]|nr:serine--tRNA ligase [Chitinophagales bacterium]